MTKDKVWSTEKEETEKEETNYETKEVQVTDWSKLADDFAVYMAQKPKTVGSRVDRFNINIIHMGATLVTAGLYLPAYMLWYFKKFAEVIDADDYKKTKYVKKEK